MRVKGLGGTDAAERARVVRRVHVVLVFQLSNHVGHEARVKVLAAEVRVARSGLHLEKGIQTPMAQGIISMIKWIWTSRLSIKNSPSPPARSGLHLHPGTSILLLKESTKITTQTFLDVTCVQLFILARFFKEKLLFPD